MYKTILLLTSICLFLSSPLPALATQKKPKRASKTTASKATSAPSNLPVRLRLTNGRELTGKLIDINVREINISLDNGSSITTSLQEVETMTIGEKAVKKIDPQFLNEADVAYKVLLALVTATDNQIRYNEYQTKLADTKSAVETFINKNQNSNQTELFRTMRLAVRSFEMVIPIWSLRVGQEQHKYVTDSSEQMRQILESFPEIKQVTWKQNDRYLIEKVIAWVWVQASQQVEQSRQQLAQLRR